MEFKQKITTEDLVKYNIFLLDQKILLKINTKIIGIIALGFLAFAIYEGNVIGSILFAILFVYSFLLFFPILRFFIRRKTIKGITRKELIIVVKANDEGIYYALESETDVKIYPWNSVEMAFSTVGHIYVRINYNTHLIINKTSVPNIEELEALLINKLGENIRYKKIKRVH